MHVQSVGLHVVATVCDMGTNNVKAIKLLGSTREEPFFQFQNQAIATIYDPLHLLMCTHNLFLKYDVHFKPEHMGSQLPVIAKWELIKEIYEQDKHFVIRRLVKLTDDHFAHYSVCHESELGRSSHEPHSSSCNLLCGVLW